MSHRESGHIVPKQLCPNRFGRIFFFNDYDGLLIVSSHHQEFHYQNHMFKKFET